MSVVSSALGRDAGKPSATPRTAEAAHPLTVLQIVPRLDTGGVERGTLEMVEAISGAGGRAMVVTSGGQMLPRIQRAGGEVVELDVATKNPLNIWQNAGRLARLVRERGVDVLHARSRAPAWSALMAARRTGAAFVTTYHGSYSEDLPLKRRYNSVMAMGRPTIAVSEFIRDRILMQHRIEPSRIVVIPRGADIAVFDAEAVGGERTVTLAEQWGLLDDPRPVVMLPGRLTRWKGAESLIDAAVLLKEARGGPDFLILLVGDDGGSGYGASLARRIDKAGVGDVVHMVGAVSDMAAAYKMASVVVSASTQPEAFGRVVVEAQAMGRPVIATDHGGARETVADGVSGWLYPPGNVEALANVIGDALALDASERDHMGLAARARIHAQYTVSAMQRATIAVYEEAAGRTFGRTL